MYKVAGVALMICLYCGVASATGAEECETIHLENLKEECHQCLELCEENSEIMDADGDGITGCRIACDAYYNNYRFLEQKLSDALARCENLLVYGASRHEKHCITRFNELMDEGKSIYE